MMQLPEEAEDMTPSQKLVLAVIESTKNGATQKEIMEATYMPRRTIRHAIGELQQAGHIDAMTNPRDARQSIYTNTRRQAANVMASELSE